MNFCSKYGYNYGFDGSDSEEYSDDEERELHRKIKKIRKADTNIIAVSFDKLVAPNEMFAGEPKSCQHCGGIMSCYSEKNVFKNQEDKLIWNCEFCEQSNDISNIVHDMNEIPKKDDITFMLELPKPKETETAKAEDVIINEVSTDDSYLSFCIDNSGSMSARISNSGFTRLNGVQSACVDTLNKMKTEEPNRRVELITFSEEVKYYGDCTATRNYNPIKRINESSDLNNKERIETLAHNIQDEVKSISQSFNAIEPLIRQLRTEGSTALGPALTFSVGLAAKKSGSNIILCTDGCANKGIGDLEQRNTTDSEKFYEDLADFAKEKGIVVNIITMEGTDCKLSLLRKVADKTNGVMNIVNPLNLNDEFKTILQNRIVATNVVAKLIVHHRFLYIRDDNLESEEGKVSDTGDRNARERLENLKKSVESRNIGNATTDTEITFEYGIRKRAGENKDNLKKLPFQLQISYTTQDGTKAIRVYTKELEFTTDRTKAERSIIAEDIVLTHHSQKMSKQYLDFNVYSSKVRNMAANNMYARCRIDAPDQYKFFSDEVEKTSKYQSSAQYTDRATNDSYFYAKMSKQRLLRMRNDKEEEKNRQKLSTVLSTLSTKTPADVQATTPVVDDIQMNTPANQNQVPVNTPVDQLQVQASAQVNNPIVDDVQTSTSTIQTDDDQVSVNQKADDATN